MEFSSFPESVMKLREPFDLFHVFLHVLPDLLAPKIVTERGV